MIARRWTKRDKLTLRLPPAFLDLEPGEEIEVPLGPARWIVETCTAMLSSSSPSSRLVISVPRLAAMPGQIVAKRDVPSASSKWRCSMCRRSFSADRRWYLRRPRQARGWRAPMSRSAMPAGRSSCERARKSVLGRATTVLEGGRGSIEVQLHDPDQWLVSCSEDRISLLGDNLAALGNEIIQFSVGDASWAGAFGSPAAARPKGHRERDHEACRRRAVRADRTRRARTDQPAGLGAGIPGARISAERNRRMQPHPAFKAGPRKQKLKL